MQLFRLGLFFTIFLTLASPAVATNRSRRVPGTHKLASKHGAKEVGIKHAPKARILGQRSIDDDRAAQIQTALIQKGYLSGSPSGHWDSESEAAMQKVQSDNGWQTKLVPDSRALIKLGLGPGTTSEASFSEVPNSLVPSAQ